MADFEHSYDVRWKRLGDVLYRIYQTDEKTRLLGNQLCISTDPEDKHRVALSYIPDLNFIAVSFPMARNGINAMEEQLLERMSK